jgi:hypothetical protein
MQSRIAKVLKLVKQLSINKKPKIRKILKNRCELGKVRKKGVYY